MTKRILSILLIIFALHPIFGYKGYIPDILFKGVNGRFYHNNPSVNVEVCHKYSLIEGECVLVHIFMA